MVWRKRVSAVVISAGLALTAAKWAPVEPAESAPVTPGVSVGNGAAHAAPASAAAVRFVVAPTGNEARYRVREQLVGRDLPNDAVGATGAVTGAIALDQNGAVLPGESKFVVDVTGLKSDSDRRDGYVRRRLLETERFPTVELVPTAVRGLPTSPPTGSAAAGPRSFEVIGALTVRGVTRPTAWRVTAEYRDGRVRGTAATAFTFADFGLMQPRVPILLSVADTIRLEYDFTLLPQAPPEP